MLPSLSHANTSSDPLTRERPPRAPEPGDTLAVPGESGTRRIARLEVIQHRRPSPRYLVQTEDGSAWLCFERTTAQPPLPPTAHQYLALERVERLDLRAD